MAGGRFVQGCQRLSRATRRRNVFSIHPPALLPAMQPLSSEPVELTVAADEAGHRLDAFLACRFPDYSRVHLRRVISAGGVHVEDRGGKPAYRLKAGQKVSILLPEIPRKAPHPENIPLEILYQDEHIVASTSRRAWSCIRPGDTGPARWPGRCSFISARRSSTAGGLNRPGIVHRLDRDTSGVILVARTDLAHAKLAKQFAARSIEKEYFAVVAGCPRLDSDYIDCPIGFHPSVREKMAIRRNDADESAGADVLRGFGAVRRFCGGAAESENRPDASNPRPLGHIGCPVLCDRQYGHRSQITRGEIRRDPSDEIILLARQALHARRLRFFHPATGKPMEIEAPLPPDIASVLVELRAYRSFSRSPKG